MKPKNKNEAQGAQLGEERLTYRIKTKAEDVGECVIEKAGVLVEFTLNYLDRDMQLLKRKKEELEGMQKIERAKMANINRTNPEIGEMSEALRQVVFIYTQAFSSDKVITEKVAEIDAQIKAYRDELMVIVMQTGIVIPANENEHGEEKDQRPNEGEAGGGGNN